MGGTGGEGREQGPRPSSPSSRVHRTQRRACEKVERYRNWNHRRNWEEKRSSAAMRPSFSSVNKLRAQSSCAVSAGLVFVSFSILLKLYYSVNCKSPIKRVLFIGELTNEMLRSPQLWFLTCANGNGNRYSAIWAPFSEFCARLRNRLKGDEKARRQADGSFGVSELF